MSEYRIEISQDEYERLKAMSYSERNDIVCDRLPQSILCGYGYYGHSLYYSKSDNKYYIICNIGSNCD